MTICPHYNENETDQPNRFLKKYRTVLFLQLAQLLCVCGIFFLLHSQASFEADYFKSTDSTYVDLQATTLKIAQFGAEGIHTNKVVEYFQSKIRANNGFSESAMYLRRVFWDASLAAFGFIILTLVGIWKVSEKDK
jgi:hypothetical protein